MAEFDCKSTLPCQINAALSNNKASVSLMSAWELTQGGSGGIVWLTLPITTGNFRSIDNTYDLTMELALQWVPQPNQIQFSTSTNVAAIKTDLDANATVTSNIIQAFAAAHARLSSSATITVITKGISWKITDSLLKLSFYVYVTNAGGADTLLEVYQYAFNSLVVAPQDSITPVTVISAGNITDQIDGPVLKELISENVDQNLKEFDSVFATVDVVTQLEQCLGLVAANQQRIRRCGTNVKPDKR